MDDHFGEGDIISKIDEDAQLHILSMLSPVDAVRTSMLSKYWQNMWKKLLCVLEVDDRIHQLDGIRYRPDNEIERIEFKDELLHARTNLFNTIQDIVNNFLEQNDNKKIVKLKLRLTSCLHENGVRADKVASWVRDSMGPKLVDLYLHFNYYDLAHDFVLQPNISSCTNLTSLTMVGAIDIEKLRKFQLPSLRRLRMEIYYCRISKMNNFLAACFNCSILVLSFLGIRSDYLHIPASVRELSLVFNDEPEIQGTGVNMERSIFLSVFPNFKNYEESDDEDSDDGDWNIFFQ